MDIGRQLTMFSLSLLLNIGKFFALLSDWGKSLWAKDLYIKFESVGVKVMTFVLRIIASYHIALKFILYLYLKCFFKSVVSDHVIRLMPHVEASNRKGQKESSQSSLYCQVFKVHTSTGNEIIRVTKATEK